ncbi:MAG: glutamine--tRNA ligase, partial [Desulfitobacteriaceae bacterium]
RLAPGQEVRLKHAYIIKCVDVVKDQKTGDISELRCTYDPDTKSGGPASGRKVKGTLHWVSAVHAIEAEVRLYDHLFVKENPDEVKEGQDWKISLNPDSLVRLAACKMEPSLAKAEKGSRFQFLRNGYFCLDRVESTPEHLVFNRTVSLRDSWAKIKQ